MSQHDLMSIHIEALTFKTIIGILEFERRTEQTVRIDAQIDYYYDNSKFINYADIIKIIEGLFRKKQYKLLEEALKSIKEKILSKYPQIINFSLKITKPDIISNAEVGLSMKWGFQTLKNIAKHHKTDKNN